ncbi:YybH family protein [Flagellimonas sp.]|uniref:YybH family protein n=1 Tax=Flagellimonas sp. TaxID=2058762 RepID=UPI003B511AE2
MKQIATILFVCCSMLSFGQQQKTVPQEIIESIKNDVWIPFMQAYAELDSDKLKSIHSEDIVRITIDQNQIETGAKYLAHFGGFLESMKQHGQQVDIAFAILSTAMDENGVLAYQTGYYRYSSKGKDDEKLIPRGYGYFNVGLKKENDTWKIWLDSDKNADISHEEFVGQEILYELMR